ncbi:MAG: SRPBCC domain-containing protein [Chloroflexi bacterium]|nr:SRPBCC domain-containing protein [Chloroflexota bacterium]
MQTKTVRQVVTFKVSPHEVYEALMDSKKHSEFTASKAIISRKIGGKWTAFDGSLEGVNLELIPDEKIVQSWRGSDWLEGYYSKVTFSLRKNDGGTQLTLTHSGIPEEHYEDIKQGWHDYYWDPMKQMFNKKT